MKGSYVLWLKETKTNIQRMTITPPPISNSELLSDGGRALLGCALHKIISAFLITILIA